MDIEQAIDHRTFFVWERQPPLKGGYPSEKGGGKGLIEHAIIDHRARAERERFTYL